MEPKQTIKFFRYDSPEYKLALELRTKVLRIPLGLNFTDAELRKDVTDIHFGLFEGTGIIACLTLSSAGKGRVKMRQVAVANNVQGKGLGKALSAAAERFAKERGFKSIFCHARKTAVPFYEKLGYKITGDEFTEVNIPHYSMEKRLE